MRNDVIDDLGSEIARRFVGHRDWCQVMLDVEAAARFPFAVDDDDDVLFASEAMRFGALARTVMNRLDLLAPDDRAWLRLTEAAARWLLHLAASKGMHALVEEKHRQSKERRVSARMPTSLGRGRA